MDFKPQRVIWHHSAYRPQVLQFESVNQWHKERDFPLSSLGYYVGYHYFVEYDGSIRQARKETEIGAHDTGENINSLGICLAGDFSVDLPNEAQITAVCRLLTDIRSRLYIPITRIEPHRWDDLTECPGTRLLDDWLITQYLQHELGPLARAFYYIGTSLKLL